MQGGIVVLDIDTSGNILWQNSYGNDGSESPNAICKATDGSIWIAAETETKGSEIDTAYGNTDAWFVHIDNGGNFLNAKVLGSSKQDKGFMIYPLSDGNVFAGGYFDDSDGTFPKIFYGGDDAFLTIFAPWPELVRQINSFNNGLKIYPNPANEVVHIDGVQEGASYRLLSVVGAVVREGGLMAGSNSIGVQGLSPGGYLLEVVGGGGQKMVSKVVKQ